MPRYGLFLIVIVMSLLYGQYGFAQQFVTASQLSSWLDSKSPPIVLDVRGRLAYREATIPGSLDGGIDPDGFLPDSSKDPVVLILNGDETKDFVKSWSNRLSEFHHPVWILENGFDTWVKHGGEVEVPEVSYAKPGTIPFNIPRGLCEGWEPAQVFE